MCLISGTILGDNFVELTCGHKFNYYELYNEVYKQKKKQINNYAHYRLKIHQIMCPYCRYIENSLLPLPYILPDGVDRVYGVNYPIKYTLMKNECKFILKSGKRKGQECGRLCYNNFCYYHESYTQKQVIYCDAILKSGKHKGTQCRCKAC